MQAQNFALCCQSNIKSVNWVYTRSTFKLNFLPKNKSGKCIKNIMVRKFYSRLRLLLLIHLIIRPTTRWQTNLTPVRPVSVKFLADVLWEPEHKVWTVKYGRFQSHVIKKKKSASQWLVMKIAYYKYLNNTTIILWHWNNLPVMKFLFAAKEADAVFVCNSFLLLQKQMETLACCCFNLQTSTYWMS